jgi:hypothetical protein
VTYEELEVLNVIKRFEERYHEAIRRGNILEHAGDKSIGVKGRDLGLERAIKRGLIEPEKHGHTEFFSLAVPF